MIRKLLDLIKGKGIRIGYNSGRPFNPSTQVRTSALEDIAKGKKKGGKHGS